MTDTFRKAYKEMSDEHKNLIMEIKVQAENLESLMRTIESREMSLARTNLEQSIMWATKAIAKADDKRNEE